MANITSAIKYDVACQLSIGIFRLTLIYSKGQLGTMSRQIF